MTALEQIAELVRCEAGIAIKSPQLRSLAAALERVAPGIDAAVLLRGLSDPVDGKLLLERLIDAVTVNESFFFRHMGELRSIDWRGLFDGARALGRDAVRVWSAACAAGEEPYTLAILAAEAFGTAQPPVRILGTDISPTALEFARRGRYGERAVREIPVAIRDRYLQPAGGGFEVAPALRRLAEFRRHNLARDPPMRAGDERFDLILCRNVLIYFDGATIERTCTALEAALSPHGQIIFGAADRLCGNSVGQPRTRTTSPAPQPPPSARRARGAVSTRATARSSAGPPDRAASANAGALEQARRAVQEWSLEATIEAADATLEGDPLDVDAYFVRGVAELACGDAAGAVVSLRRALYLDPLFGLAAFKLARAHEALGEVDAARRTYARAVKTLDPEDRRSRTLADSVSFADVLHACRTRVAALSAEGR